VSLVVKMHGGFAHILVNPPAAGYRLVMALSG
jgi:hypothetical protein